MPTREGCETRAWRRRDGERGGFSSARSGLVSRRSYFCDRPLCSGHRSPCASHLRRRADSADSHDAIRGTLGVKVDDFAAFMAVGAIISGAAILGIGWFLGNSALRGEADWVGIGFDGLGIYFLGVGAFDLVAALRS